jgi:hypothetical protein
MRALLRFLDIKVIVYPGRMESRGVIPPLVIEVSARNGQVSAPITSSVRG